MYVEFRERLKDGFGLKRSGEHDESIDTTAKRWAAFGTMLDTKMKDTKVKEKDSNAQTRTMPPLQKRVATVSSVLAASMQHLREEIMLQIMYPRLDVNVSKGFTASVSPSISLSVLASVLKLKNTYFSWARAS